MAEVNVLLTCAGRRVDIVRAFRAAPGAGPHSGHVVVSDLDPGCRPRPPGARTPGVVMTGYHDRMILERRPAGLVPLPPVL